MSQPPYQKKSTSIYVGVNSWMDSMKRYESPTHDRYVGIVRSFWEDFPNQPFKFFVAQGTSKSSKWVDPKYMNMKIQPSIVIKVAIIYVIQHWSLTQKGFQDCCRKNKVPYTNTKNTNYEYDTTETQQQNWFNHILLMSHQPPMLSCFGPFQKLLRWFSMPPSFTLDSKLWEFKIRRSLQLARMDVHTCESNSKNTLGFRFARNFSEWMMVLERWISRNYCNISVSNHSSFVTCLNLAWGRLLASDWRLKAYLWKTGTRKIWSHRPFSWVSRCPTGTEQKFFDDDAPRIKAIESSFAVKNWHSF